MNRNAVLMLTGLIVLIAAVSHAEVKIVIDRNVGQSATSDFKFEKVSRPSRNDAATQATFSLVAGQRDRNGGDLDKLHDGKVPTKEDQPAENFFFNAGTEGGRILIELGNEIEIKQVNTYSWHGAMRGPQVYRLFASDGKAAGFNPRPQTGADPVSCGWKAIAQVDTRPQTGAPGGQYGVSVQDSAGALGPYRYLLFDISATERSDPFGNTFFSEIDVVGAQSEPLAAEPANPSGGEGTKEIVEAGDGKYKITIDTTEAPDLTEWAHQELAPVVRTWYPKLVELLPSEGYEAPAQASIVFSANMRGVAATGGTRVRCAADWFRHELQGEAKGAVVHELVHVVQSYGAARRTNPNPSRTPGWVVEGITDYVRWFLYEPETHGAEIDSRSLSQARYDANYRVSANFLNWVTTTYDKELVRKLNAAAREGRYSDELWKTATGHSVEELGDQWKADLKKKIAADAEAAAKNNTLTEEEKAAGWFLLFNGKSLDGWHNFKREDVRPGWQIRDGVLVCADPHDAGDLCTKDQYDWFELRFEYNISPAGNSGIMYHVTDEGGAAWATGPEFQLEDNEKAADPVRCGWLYALYQPPNDPKTGKILDATRPAGEWNQVRLLISPEKCEHEINGVKYFDYVLGSEDFKQRVAKSKFNAMPRFAQSNSGYIALQGDHGQVSFRNIKLRPIRSGK
ncbi:MAG TPA: DUF1080 domain-containing protein [Candidatus Sumerlaeota bacterium]|nr:DUF1080 domain-containing protein [Candidatus Sumerlaeota bacterium]